MTIDVEDYFHVSAFEPYIPRGAWDGIEGRLEPNVDRILQKLADHGAYATFFTLGWVAERHRSLVRRIVAAGHELASHGYEHHRVTALNQSSFRADVHRAKQVLEGIGCVPVSGYRAPSFSMAPAGGWARDVLLETGHAYSSSVYPIRHDHYGAPSAPRFPQRLGGGLLEIPVTTARLWGVNLPCGGGGYFRLLPYSLSEWMIRRVNHYDRQIAVFYLHPWEIDAAQPRLPGLDARTRFRHYHNLARTSGRLDRLLGAFRWNRLDHLFLSAA